MSEFLKAMAFRHACKAFNPEKAILEEQFASMLEVARTSPSSFGMEPWRLIVVRNPNLRKALKSACWNQNQITDCSELVIFTTDNDTVRSDSSLCPHNVRASRACSRGGRHLCGGV
jgi:nitroreductase